MVYSIYEIKERRSGQVPAPTSFIAKTQTLIDARKKASELIWKEHIEHPYTERPIRRGIFKAEEFIGKVTWCIRCKKVLWNEGKGWYALTKSGRLGKKVY